MSTYAYICCHGNHSNKCVKQYPLAKDNAFARILLRVPDVNAFPACPVRLGITQTMAPPSPHKDECFSLPSDSLESQSHAFHIQKFFNILKRCEAEVSANVALALRAVVTEDTRWHVVEHVPGSYVRVAVLFEWKELLQDGGRPHARLQALADMGKGVVQLHPPLYRHHVELTLDSLKALFVTEPCSNPDFMGLELIRSVEAQHAAVPAAVAAFMTNGGDVTLYAAAAVADAFAKPTVASLKAAIDVSRFLTVTLKPYQIATIAWAIDREQHGAVTDCTHLRSSGLHSFVFRYSWRHKREDAPAPGAVTRGGLILEEMGMGKTIEMLCVIIAGSHMQEMQEMQDMKDMQATRSSSSSIRTQVLDVGLDAVVSVPPNPYLTYAGVPPSTGNGGTLVIVPLSLMNQWANEIDTVITHGMEVLRPMFYHGSARHKIDVSSLRSAPVVITSYETVAADSRCYRSHAKREAAAALTAWQCPGKVYLDASFLDAGEVHDRRLAVNDVVLMQDGAYRVLGIASDTRLHAVPYFSDADAPEDECVDVLNAAGLCTNSNLWHCTEGVHALPRLGSLRVCRASHPSASTPTCDTCGTNCFHLDLDMDGFINGLLAPPLERVHWTRIVLDESHKMQVTAPSLFHSIMRLQAPLKWCMTGTPMPKSVDNLRGQLIFLGVPDAPRPSRAANPWLSSSMIRHVKQSCLMSPLAEAVATSLPPIAYQDVVLPLSASDQEAYDAARTESRTWYTARDIDAGGGGLAFHRKMYQSILKERRACAVIAPALFMKRKRRPGSETTPELPDVPADALNVEDDCPVCLEAIPHAVVLPCRHCFCHECIPTVLEAGVKKCPLCKLVLTTAQVDALRGTCRAIGEAIQFQNQLQEAEAEAETETETTTETETETETPSAILSSCASKFDALRTLVQASRNPTLVFTQFDEVVHTLKELFKQAEEALPVNVMTGSTSRQGRERAIKNFKMSARGVLILSLRTAAVGLNLTHAAQVVFMEPPVSSGLEAQAVGRVHRLGQMNSVMVFYLISENTIEERMRMFKDNDVLEADRTSSRVGEVTVCMTEMQKRQWRQRWLENLML